MVLLDGKALSQLIKTKIKEEILLIRKNIIHKDFEPHLAIIQVGNNSDSSSYIKMKSNAAKETGIKITHLNFDSKVTQLELIDAINRLNHDETVNGLIVQQPLPSHLNKDELILKMDPMKDVDGFHPLNIGLLVQKGTSPYYYPCTPLGIIKIIDHYNIELKGKNVSVLGRSDIVGKPISHMLLDRNATVTICHSNTTNVDEHLSKADILISAIGVPEFVKADKIKQDCVVIDVGINYVEDKTKKQGYRICGDVQFDSASRKTSFITPVPGGVGPMTVACLMENCLLSAKRHSNIE